MSEMKQGPESIKKPTDEIYLRTKKGAMKGDVIAETATERTVKTTWTHDGKSVGAIVKIPSQAKPGEVLHMKVLTPNGREVDHETGIIELAARGEKGTFVTLDELVQKTEETLSANVPENKTKDENEYEKVMQKYAHVSQAERYARTNMASAKCDFPDNTEEFGWKVHLNVEPRDVVTTSDYLRKNNFAHKYRDGGAGIDGKAFTVYFGSKAMLTKWVQNLSADLANVLRKPYRTNESAEFAPGITGRFVAGDARSTEYGQYGEFGIPLINEEARNKVIEKMQGPKAAARDRWAEITREEKIALAASGYKSLAEKYGRYFHG